MRRSTAGLSTLCVAGLLAGCSVGTPGTTSTATATATATPIVTTAPATTSSAEPGSSDGSGFPGLLTANGKAGTYQLMAASPHIRLTLPDGWSVFFDEPEATYMNIGAGHEFLVARMDQVIDPETNGPAPIPEDLMAWFVEHPRLNA